MFEQSKAAERRVRDWHYGHLYFVGDGLDIGAGPDGLSKLTAHYPKITSVRDWDLADGDATYLPGVGRKSVDFISASHVLEHLDHPDVALEHWIDVVRAGGHLVITVPDSIMYERDQWPSRFGVGHRKRYSTDPLHRGRDMVNVLSLLERVSARVALERLLVIREHFDPAKGSDVDQSMGPAECAIEIVLRRL